MTRETFDIAKKIISDIDSLKNIKAEYNDCHWISFCGPSVGQQLISKGMLRDDLEKFIDAEIAKLEEELEKL